MTIDEARAKLRACVQHELRDRAFGDSEFTWEDGSGNEVASGYRGYCTSKKKDLSAVTIGDGGFLDADARALFGVYRERKLSFNDAGGDHS